MKKLIFLTVCLLTVALLVCSCSDSDEKSKESGVSTEETQSGELAPSDNIGSFPTDEPSEPVLQPTEPQGSNDLTDPSDEPDYDDFIEENFGDHDEDGGYDYKEEVGGKPVTEFGSVDEEGEEIFTSPVTDEEPSEPEDPKEPTEPKPTEPKPTEPKPTEPDNKPTEAPTEPDTEPSLQPTGPDTTEPTEPVAPKDIYNSAVEAIGDYTADVQYKCEVELSDGSVTKYVYKYRVSKQGQSYSATYMEKGKEKIASFDSTVGIMTVDGKEKYCTLADFYRFCSMVEPLPLKVYFFEHSEAGTDFTSRMSAEEHRDMLLNTSPLFNGFDRMEGVNMGKLYFNGHVNAEGVYTGSEIAFDLDYTEKTLGKMLFRVSVEVDYVV